MIEMKMDWMGGSKTLKVNQTESDFWKAVGMQLENIPVSNELRIQEVKTGKSAKLNLIKRGNVKHADGTVSPSLYVVPEFNEIDDLEHSEYTDAYLTCINPTGNNYKYYWLRPRNVGGETVEIGATYGRLGSERGEMYGTKDLNNPYEPYLYWIRYYEKLSKGYIDQSDIYLAEDDPEEVEPDKTESKMSFDEACKLDGWNNLIDLLDLMNTVSTIEPAVSQETEKKVNPASVKLYNVLQKFAHNVVEATLAEPQRITKAQIRRSRELIEALQEAVANDCTVEDFNTALTMLMTVSPRRADMVQMMLAMDKSDFAAIIDREEGLVNAMEAVKLAEKKPEAVQKKSEPSFEDFDIEVHEPSADERKQIVDLIDSSMQHQIKEIYMVNPKHQREVFEEYCKDHKIQDRRLLLHGSRAENWFSITRNSLTLPQNNNARKTGQALGPGIYLANCSIKSSHYTFGKCVIGVFESAYGKPLMVHDTDHYCYQQHNAAELKAKGKDSLHYIRKGAAWADEHVFFDEKALCMTAIIIM